MDRLRGEFRRKEKELLAPMLSKYANIEMRVAHMFNELATKVKE